MRPSTLAVVAAVAVLVAGGLPSAAGGGPIMDSAKRLAAGIELAQYGEQQIPKWLAAGTAPAQQGQQQILTEVPCDETTAEGAAAADTNESGFPWLFAGMIGPVVTPVLIGTTEPKPTIDALQERFPFAVARAAMQVEDIRSSAGVSAAMVVGAAAAEEMRCFMVGYAQKTREKKSRWSWVGSAISGSIVAVVKWALDKAE